MDRRVIRRLPAAAGALLALILLSTCSSPFSLRDAIETEVKIATGKFLAVNLVVPAKNAEGVNPGSPIAIEFDRDIDLATVTTASIQFTPAATFGTDDIIFNTSTNTLYIDPKPYLAGPASYTVTITKAVKGTDSSELHEEYFWSFSTRLYPAGSVQIDTDNNPAIIPTYVLDSNPVYLVLTRNSINVTGVGIGQTAEQAITAAATPATYEDSKSNVVLASGEGVKDIYVVFVDTANNKSDPEHDTIIRDLLPPNVNSGADIVLNQTTTSVSQNATADDVHSGVAGSGVASYLWSKYSGTGNVTFGTPAAEDTTITADTDGTFVLRLTVSDKAGRSAYDSVTLVRDTIAPTAPTVNGTASPGTALPSYTWTPGGGGAGFYRYNHDGGAWSAETTLTGYSATTLSYGGHSFYVQERDVNGNWSASGSWYYFIYPTFLRPVHASTGVSRTPKFVFGEGEVPRYTTYEIWGTTSPKAGYVRAVSGLTKYTWTWNTTALPGSTKYYWYYRRIVTSPKPSTTDSPVYSFTTGP